MSLSWHIFPNLNLASPLTWLPKIMSLGKSYSFSCMSLVCACIYPYLVQVCTNSIQTSTFRWRHTWTVELQVRCCSYPNVSIHPEFGRPSCFQGCYCFTFLRSFRIELVDHVPLAFLSSFGSHYVLVLFWPLYN